MTQVYQYSTKSTSYWSLPKFLSRGKWSTDKVAAVLRRQVQTIFSKGIYVYDERHTINEGLHQYGSHFLRNTRYQTRDKNQSKFHHGHAFGALGWLCETAQGSRLFPLSVRMMCPGKSGMQASLCSSEYVRMCLPVSSYLTGVSIGERCGQISSHRDITCSVVPSQMLPSIRYRTYTKLTWLEVFR